VVAAFFVVCCRIQAHDVAVKSGVLLGYNRWNAGNVPHLA